MRGRPFDSQPLAARPAMSILVQPPIADRRLLSDPPKKIADFQRAFSKPEKTAGIVDNLF